MKNEHCFLGFYSRFLYLLGSNWQATVNRFECRLDDNEDYNCRQCGEYFSDWCTKLSSNMSAICSTINTLKLFLPVFLRKRYSYTL